MTVGRRTHRPTRPARGDARSHAAAVGALAGAAIFAGVASGARPFTVPADVAVSVGSACFAGTLVIERLRPDAGPWRRLDPERPAGARGTWVPWLVVAVVLVCVELASYFHGGPRADYPTLSSGLDALFHYRGAKAAAWFVWLVAGGYLARR
ncbi:MAG TPA: hypothetical protein VMD28_04695 [Acidimicrobiales bacterium]|nr:hypothetical protein [Acidimicrobiales bacterium]